MINTKDKRTQEIMKELHFSISKKYKTLASLNEKIRLESKIIEILCENFEASPANCAYTMNKRYYTEIEHDDVLDIFRFMKISNRFERREVLEWANEVAGYFEGALNGNAEDLKKFDKRRRDGALKNGGSNRTQNRIAILMICNKFPEIISEEDKEKLSYLGSTLAKFVLFDLADAMKKILHENNNRKKENKKISYIEYENLLIEKNSLEEKLNRTEEMLQELQEEFEEQLRESKITELTSFFAKLNSENYGCILDQLMVCRSGMNALKKRKFELPLEINGLFIMIKNLAKFTQDSHIVPIMKPNDKKDVKVSDIEFCRYEGTPFKNENDIKQIVVISPGWIFRDKEIQISRPKVKEVEQND